MTQASVNITQQFKDGGVVPATLTGQNAVSKTYVDEQLAIRDANISAAAGAASSAQADIDAHEASTTAHPAQNITYSGLVSGAGNVKQGLDNLYTRVNNIIADGDSSAEVVDARGGYPVLGDRLNGFDAQLAETTQNINTRAINAKYPPAPLVAVVGDGVADDAPKLQAMINYLAVGGELLIPEGDHLIKSSLVIPVASSGINLIGTGIGSVLKLGFDGDLLTFENIASGATLSHHRIYNLSFAGNGRASGSLIHVKCASTLNIEHCYFLGFTIGGDGIYVEGNPTSSDACHDVNIRNNYFDSKGVGGRSAIYLASTAADMQISGNYMELRHSVDYCIYLKNCGTMQIFDNHAYNAKVNIVRIDGAFEKNYKFTNNFFDYSMQDTVYIDGTTTDVANGSISFINCIFMLAQSGYSSICMTNKVYNVEIRGCTFTNPATGAKSAIRAITSAGVDSIRIEDNIFLSPSTYTNGVIENLWSAKCVVQNNQGYKKTVTAANWLSLNAWSVFPEQCSGLLYLSFYVTNATDGNIIIHYREGTSGVDFTIYNGYVPSTATSTKPFLVVIPVSPEANIQIGAASWVTFQTKVFVPFNV